jgi:hypothetical protein
MDELIELRAHIEQGRYAEALVLIGEMEEMSRDEKINKVESFLHILLLHLIKQHAEKRSTRSWEVSIKNAVDGVKRINKRRKAGGYYLTRDELREGIDEIYLASLRQASLEAFEGRYSDTELATKISEDGVKEEALRMVLAVQ